MNLLQKIIGIAALTSPLAVFAFPIATSGEGLRVLVNKQGTVNATYQGTSASYSDDLYLVTNDGIANNDIFIFNNHNSAVGSTVNLGSFAANTELVFRLHVNNTGRDFFSGYANRNPDNHVHARVQQNYGVNTSLLSFEDLYGGPFNYNDLSFTFTNTDTTIQANSVPEPTSTLLLFFGLASLVVARRCKT